MCKIDLYNARIAVCRLRIRALDHQEFKAHITHYASPWLGLGLGDALSISLGPCLYKTVQTVPGLCKSMFCA